MNAADCIAHLRAKELTLGLAESCTGGLIASSITDVSGCSEVLMGGVVTYSNASKIKLLNVPGSLIQEHGAVSEPVASAMAEGARTLFESDIALSVTGIAGPGGGSTEKPVGLVFIGLASVTGIKIYRNQFAGDRSAVRRAALMFALKLFSEV